MLAAIPWQQTERRWWASWALLVPDFPWSVPAEVERDYSRNGGRNRILRHRSVEGKVRKPESLVRNVEKKGEPIDN